MELADNCDELGWVAKFLCDFLESIPTDCIKGLGQINKGCVEVTMLFHAFLLELVGSKGFSSHSGSIQQHRQDV